MALSRETIGWGRLKRSVAPRGARATALTWVVPRPKQQGVGDRGLTESARRADPRAPADRAPRAARLARPLVVRAPPAGRRRGVERGSGARGSTREDERKRRPIRTSTARAPPCSAAAARTTQTTRPPTRRRPHRAGVADRDPRGRGGGSHGAERRAKRRRDTTRRGGGPEEHDKNLPFYLDGHPTSERAHEPTARRTSTAWRRSARASTPPVAVDAAPRGGRATALTWVVPRPEQQGVGDRGLTESARRADPRAPADRAPRAARLARPLVVRAPPTGRRRGVERGSGARGSTSEDERKRRPIRTSTARAPPAQLRRREPPRPRAPHVPASAPRGRRRSRSARAGGGSSHGAERRAKRRRDTSAERREDATRHDVAADPRNTTGLFRATSTATRRASARTSRLHAARAPRGAGARARARHPPRSTRRRAVDVPLP